MLRKLFLKMRTCKKDALTSRFFSKSKNSAGSLVSRMYVSTYAENGGSCAFRRPLYGELPYFCNEARRHGA